MDEMGIEYQAYAQPFFLVLILFIPLILSNLLWKGLTRSAG